MGYLPSVSVLRAFGLSVVLSLAASTIAAPASAATSYRLYLHGALPAGEAEIGTNLATLTSGFKAMDGVRPTGAVPKSMFVTDYVVGPDTTCSGNHFFPTWSGRLNGVVRGTLTVSLNAVVPPTGRITNRVYLFADANGLCKGSPDKSRYVRPITSKVVSLPTGVAETKIVFRALEFRARKNLTIMVTPWPRDESSTETHSRLLYDSTGYRSRIEFSCTGVSGKACR